MASPNQVSTEKHADPVQLKMKLQLMKELEELEELLAKRTRAAELRRLTGTSQEAAQTARMWEPCEPRMHETSTAIEKSDPGEPKISAVASALPPVVSQILSLLPKHACVSLTSRHVTHDIYMEKICVIAQVQTSWKLCQ